MSYTPCLLATDERELTVGYARVVREAFKRGKARGPRDLYEAAFRDGAETAEQRVREQAWESSERLRLVERVAHALADDGCEFCEGSGMADEPAGSLCVCSDRQLQSLETIGKTAVDAKLDDRDWLRGKLTTAVDALRQADQALGTLRNPNPDRYEADSYVRRMAKYAAAAHDKTAQALSEIKGGEES